MSCNMIVLDKYTNQTKNNNKKIDKATYSCLNCGITDWIKILC